MITRGIFSQQILTVCAIGPLQSDRAEALPCHMITVGGATLTLLSTLRSIEPSWTHWNLNHWSLIQNLLEHAPSILVLTDNQAVLSGFKQQQEEQETHCVGSCRHGSQVYTYTGHWLEYTWHRFYSCMSHGSTDHEFPQDSLQTKTLIKNTCTRI